MQNCLFLKDKKFLVLGLTESPYEVRYINRFYDQAKDLGIEKNIYFYAYEIKLLDFIPRSQIIFDDKLANFVRTKDHKFYEDFLNCALLKKAKAIIPRVVHPEYLYSSLICMDQRPEISLGGYGFELFIRSRSRANIVKKILKLNNISGLLLHTIGGREAKLPEKTLTKDNLSKKIILNTEPLFDSLSKYQGDKIIARNFFNLDQNKKLILFFGSFYPWKGPDILLKAIDFLDNTYKVIFAGNTDSYFGEITNFEKKNVFLIDKPTDDVMYKLFHACDLVACPYGPTYEFSSSSVFMSSILSGKASVVPNIEPFVTVINNYKCGEVFNLEDSFSLAQAIKKISENIDNNPNFYNSKLINFCNSIISWEEILNFHMNFSSNV
tara:strand:+ start:5370 stop:6512 length:1143 start_codon:yes stop_codon:yes gene_type:complete